MKTLIMIALAAFVGVGNAQPGGGERGMRAGGGERLRELLNLSDETADKIEQLGVEHRKSRIALRAKLDAARVDFHALMRGENPDEKLAMARQKEMSGIREELQASALAHRFAVDKLLTPEQRKIMRDHRGGMIGQSGMGRHDGMRGFREGRREAPRGDRFMKYRRDFRHCRMLDTVEE